MIKNPTDKEVKNAKGTCYKRAFRFLAQLSGEEKKKAKLVHGKIVGRYGKVKDIRFGHAWVEKDGFVYDLPYRSKKLIITSEHIYYSVNRVSDDKKYSCREMHKIGLEKGGNFGPWE